MDESPRTAAASASSTSAPVAHGPAAASITGIRKRAPNACVRCRQQKIRCGGGRPCTQCSKKKLDCRLDDGSQKVLVSQKFLKDLERRAAGYERGSEVPIIMHQQQQPQPSTNTMNTILDHDDGLQSDASNDSISNELSGEAGRPVETTHITTTPTTSRQLSPGSPLINPLALGASAYFPDATGRPIYLGPSSNWSFTRRILSMSHERTRGSPLVSDNLHFQGKVYDLDWDGTRSTSAFSNIDRATLPSPDHATYLINAVKFHCGQMFHLFEEQAFMDQFAQFHDPGSDKGKLMPLWHVHYLLVLAFGKAFLARSIKGRTPPGADYFVQAMKLLPDVTFLCTNPIETMEILCCAALYLQSVDFRSSGFRLIGQALRIGLEHGMHTDMQSQHVSQHVVQRCRKTWWTVYMLDRQTSALMGVPSTIRDEDISAELPLYPHSTQKSMALEIQVKLSRVIAQISDTVYGVQARLDLRYLSNTKSALQEIAKITDQLNCTFDISASRSIAGISRLSVYLHLLRHQCIVVATRPLLYTFLEMKLCSQEVKRRQYGNVKGLIQMCIESANRMLDLLSELQEHGLLECFLPFDLDATHTSAVVLQVGAVVDSALLANLGSSSHHRAYAILDEMISRGNLVAGCMKSEMRQLEAILDQLSTSSNHNRGHSATVPQGGISGGSDALQMMVDNAGGIPVPTMPLQASTGQDSMSNFSWEDPGWTYPITTEQMMTVADTLESEGLFNWLSLCAHNIPNGQ